MAQEGSFARWVRDQRKKLDLTQEELADLVCCSPETIRKIEAGRRKPSRSMVEVLGTRLGVGSEELPALVRLARLGTAQGAQQIDTATGGAFIATDQPAPIRLTNLPASRSTFIGREKARERVCELLVRADVRLLTLTGPPGIGKTRLSFQAAGDLLDHFPDGVFYVPLSPVSDPARVGPAVADTLGVKETPNRPIIESLKDFLRNKRMLLVLDNFEQVVPAGVLVAELLEDCARLTVMVSSRAALRVYGEHEFPLAPLTLPGAADPLPDPDSFSRYEGVQLFTERSQLVRPSFSLTEQNAPMVAEICRRLDGLPLAIELAAARSKLFPPDALLPRIDRMLDLLSGGMVDLPPRQQTLRGAITWSYDLLKDAEKRFYRRMSVFVGAVSLDAIETVCLDEGDFDTDILDLAASLLDKSLLQQSETEGEPRFWMLWTIREYAQEKLAQSGEADAISGRHARWYLEVAEKAEPYLHSAARAEWLAALRRENGNLRAALSWCQADSGDHEMGLRIAGALHWYWYFQGYLTEGRNWIERALVLCGPQGRTAARAAALNAAGKLALIQGDYEGMVEHLDDSVSIWRDLADKRGLAYALTDLGIALVLTTRDSNSGGARLQEEALTMFREIGDKWGLAFALDWMGDSTVLLGGAEETTVAYKQESLKLYRELEDKWGIAGELVELGMSALRQGKYAVAQSRLAEALGMEREIDDKWLMAHCAQGQAIAAFCLGDYPRAADLFRESLRIFEELGNRLRVAGPLRGLGNVAMMQGDYDPSEGAYLHSLSIVHKLGSMQDVALCLMGLGALAVARREFVRAARLLAAAAALREASHGLLPTSDEIVRDLALDAVDGGLDPEARAAALEWGRSVSVDEAVAYAHEKY